jgi:hypothetical protein
VEACANQRSGVRTPPPPRSEPRAICFWLSLVAHLALPFLLLSSPISRGSPSAEILPIDVGIIRAINARQCVPDSPLEPDRCGSTRSKSKATTAVINGEERRTALERVTLGSDPSISRAARASERDPGRSEPIDDSRKKAIGEERISEATMKTFHKAPRGFVEEADKKVTLGFKSTERTDWEANPVEDRKVIYTSPDKRLKLTVREAYSGGFAATHFASGFGGPSENGHIQDEAENSGVARSQRFDWTLLDQGNFGLTAFGYYNEVGRQFVAFGTNKKEFKLAGTNIMKAGAQIVAGAFKFGFAQANIKDAGGGDNIASMQESSVSVDLKKLVTSLQHMPMFFKALPNSIQFDASNKRGLDAVSERTVSAGVNGSWDWDSAYASLGYWTYSSDFGGVATTSGHGVDASFGMSSGMDVSFSYDAEAEAPGAMLHTYSASIFYVPDGRLPGFWAQATVGNSYLDPLTGKPSAVLLSSTSAENWSYTLGLELRNLIWGERALRGAVPVQQSSAKLLYRNISSGTELARDEDSVVAVMLQRSF